MNIFLAAILNLIVIKKKSLKLLRKPGKDNIPSPITKLVFDYFADTNILLITFPK